MMRLIVTWCPSFAAVDDARRLGHMVEMCLCDHTAITVEVHELVFDRGLNPQHRIRGKIVTGHGEGSTFAGRFNDVGAGIFDTVDEPIARQPAQAR